MKTLGSRTALLAFAMAALLPALLVAGDRSRAAKPQPQPTGESVEMFAGIEKGQIEVQLIPKDATECRVLVKNKTQKPLTVKLPEAFAGVPVLAQGALGNVGGNNNNNFNNNNNMNQGFGGGMGGMGMGGMGMGGMGMGGMGGMGFMNVPPEKVGQIKVATVCLDHGKRDPQPSMKYVIRPIDTYTEKPGVRELCQMLGRGMVSQRAAQVAAWHLNNGLSFPQLATKEIRHANGTREPYFSPMELQAGLQAATFATKLAREAQSPTTPGSLSQQ